jgi:hypothetical protein
MPAEHMPAEHMPAEQMPAEQMPAEQMPAEQMPAAQSMQQADAFWRAKKFPAKSKGFLRRNCSRKTFAEKKTLDGLIGAESMLLGNGAEAVVCTQKLHSQSDVSAQFSLAWYFQHS